MTGRKEHYVPQFYLKNFGDRIYLYDKSDRKIHPSTPKDIAFERNFYVKPDDNDAAERVEHALGQFEGVASTVISNIIRAESLAGLSRDDWSILYVFVMLQFARTPEFRNRRREDLQYMLDWFVEQLGVTDFHFVEKEEDAGPIHFGSMLDFIKLAPYLIQMRVRLLKNDTGIPLWTSDNPVVCYNGLTGKLGVDSPGVEFYLPLTPKLLLMFYDDTYFNLLDDKAGTADVSEARRTWERKRIISKTACMNRAYAIHANRLQTVFSTRFVYSNKPDFDMMDEFLEFLAQGAPGLLDRAHPLRHNLQNALRRYRTAVRDADMRRSFLVLYDSLRLVTNIGWPGNGDGEEFDDSVRKLAEDPELPIDSVRRFYNRIKSGGPDSHADEAHMAKQIKELRRIVAKVMLCRIDESRAQP